jgi:hypothetical protein
MRTIPLTIWHFRQSWGETAPMITPVPAITKQKRGLTATAVTELTSHIRKTMQRCLGCTPGCLQRHIDICQEPLHLGINQTSTPTPTSSAQECSHLLTGGM